MSGSQSTALNGYPLTSDQMHTLLTVDGFDNTGYTALTALADKKQVLSAFSNADVKTSLGSTPMSAKNETAIKKDVADTVLVTHSVSEADYITNVTAFNADTFRGLSRDVQANLIAALGEQDAQLVLTGDQAATVANVLTEMNSVLTGEKDLDAKLNTYPLPEDQMLLLLTKDGLTGTDFHALTTAEKKSVLSAFTDAVVTANIHATLSAANQTAIKKDIADSALAGHGVPEATYLKFAASFDKTSFMALPQDQQSNLIAALGEQDAQVLLTADQIAALPTLIGQYSSAMANEPAPLPVFDPIARSSGSPVEDAYYQAKADTFETLCNTLKTALSGAQTPATKQTAGAAMTQILSMLASVNTFWIFDRYLAFYKANYTTVLRDQTALSFQSAMSDGAQKAARVVHAIFFALASKEQIHVDPGTVKTTTHIMDLVSWIESKPK